MLPSIQRALLTSITVIAGFTGSLAQFDSLKEALRTAQSYEESFVALQILSKRFRSIDTDSALLYANQAQELAIIEGSDDDRRIVFGLKARTFHISNEADSAETYYLKEYDLSVGLGKLTAAANCYNNIGVLYYYRSEYDKALDFYLKSVDVYEQTGKQSDVAEALNNVATVHYQLGDFHTAGDYFSQSLEKHRIERDSSGITRQLSNLGELLVIEGLYDSALVYLEEAEDISNLTGDQLHLLGTLTNKGRAYKAMEHISKSRFFFEESIELGEKMLEGADVYYSDYLNDHILDAYVELSQLLCELGENDISLGYLDKTLHLADSVGAKKYTMLALLNYSKVYEALNEHENSLSYYKQYVAAKDSIFNEERNSQIVNLQSKFNTEKKNKEIAILNQERKLQAARLQRQLLLRNGLVAFCLLIVTAGISMIYKHRQVQKTNRLLSTSREEVLSQNRKLMALDEEKNHLIGIVSHDLRGPLNRIFGLMQLIDKDPQGLSTAQSESVHLIMQSIGNLRDLVLKILDVNAIESQSIKLKLEETNPKRLVEEVISEMADPFSRKGIDVEVKYKHQHFGIIVDWHYAKLVVTNLLSNALKFSPPRTKVLIETAANREFLRFKITDQGPGISKEDIPRLFGKYQKLSARPTGGENSHGLGLSIVKKYTELMGGQVWCESIQGQGASFIVQLKKAKDNLESSTTLA